MTSTAPQKALTMRHTPLALILLCAGTLVAQPPKGGPGGGGPPQMPPTPVTCVTVAEQTVPIVYELNGVAEASQTVEIRARIRGYIAKRHFTEGTTVKEGDLLYTIDKRLFETDVEAAAARLDDAEARLRLAKQELDRVTKLDAERASSQGDLERAQAEYGRAQAIVRLSRAEVENAKLQLGFTEVRAPIGGIVGRARKETGSLVDDGNNSLLTDITCISPIYIWVGLSEREYLAWQQDVAKGVLTLSKETGQQFQLLLEDGSVFPEMGKLGYETLGFRPETGTSARRAEFPNAQGILKPGQYVKVRVLGWQRPHTIAIPQRAVSQSSVGASVYVVGADNKAELRPVKLGPWSGKDWVILEGLNSGDRVVVDGVMKVHPGSSVQVGEPGEAEPAGKKG